MRDPIPWDRPRLLMLLASQYAFMGATFGEIHKSALALDVGNMPVPKLRSLVWDNANRIYDYLSSRPYPGSF